MTVHHQRLTGWLACGRSPDLYEHDYGTGGGVTCRTCLRSLERRPAASALLRDFMEGTSVAGLADKHLLTRREVEWAIREVVK